MKMHDGEAVIDVALVRWLVAAQFPGLTSLPVREVRSTGTVNAIYRLGDRLCARLPRLERYAESLEREWRWLPDLAPGLTLRVPEPVSLGQPSAEYPFTWAIYRWIDGHPYADDATWHRARGIALTQAAALIPYYAVSNPAFAELGRRTVEQVIADFRSP
jgi:aminoglycoside phosphotransferase (APT) family kinase protein